MEEKLIKSRLTLEKVEIKKEYGKEDDSLTYQKENCLR